MTIKKEKVLAYSHLGVLSQVFYPKDSVSWFFFFFDQTMFTEDKYYFHSHVTKTRYSSRIEPINDALVHLAGCKAYENKLYPTLLTLYGQYSKKPTGKS